MKTLLIILGIISIFIAFMLWCCCKVFSDADDQAIKDLSEHLQKNNIIND